ncbi:MAG: hypothetical protein WC858_01690 [Parcubacteria group bacterium]|jgi:hypothetical protein
MKRKIALGAITIVSAIILAGCSKGNKNNSQVSAPENKNFAETTTEEISLEDAYRKIGMKCNGPDFQATCSWNETKFTISKPSDWKKDVELRNKACDDGYINPQYLLVSDNKSWHISGEQNEDVVKLTDALAGAGLDAKAIRYCH